MYTLLIMNQGWVVLHVSFHLCRWTSSNRPCLQTISGMNMRVCLSKWKVIGGKMWAIILEMARGLGLDFFMWTLPGSARLTSNSQKHPPPFFLLSSRLLSNTLARWNGRNGERWVQSHSMKNLTACSIHEPLRTFQITVIQFYRPLI